MTDGRVVKTITTTTTTKTGGVTWGGATEKTGGWSTSEKTGGWGASEKTGYTQNIGGGGGYVAKVDGGMQNNYLTYTNIKHVTAIRNTLCYGIFCGKVKGFIEERLDEKDPAWTRHGAKVCYFVNSQEPARNKCFISNYVVCLRHCGRLAGLYPLQDPISGLRIDDLIELAANFKVAFSKNADQSTADRLLIQTFRHFDDTIEKNLAKTGSLFCVGTSLSIADFELISLIEFLNNPKFKTKQLYDEKAFQQEFIYCLRLVGEVAKSAATAAMTKREWAHRAELKNGRATEGEAHSMSYVSKHEWAGKSKK